MVPFRKNRASSARPPAGFFANAASMLKTSLITFSAVGRSMGTLPAVWSNALFSSSAFASRSNSASLVETEAERAPVAMNETRFSICARTYFYKALASDGVRAKIGIGFLNKLFEIERAIAKQPPDKRLAIRRERAGPVIDALETWRDEQLASNDVHDATPIRRAFKYLRNHWGALKRFLSDGKIPIHNNRSELELRRLVIGRANWLFVRSDESANWTCTLVSLVASCQLHGIDPEAYLRDLFRLLPIWPANRFLELAPKNWCATRARLDLDALALPLGPIKIPQRLQATNETSQEARADQIAGAHEG